MFSLDPNGIVGKIYEGDYKTLLHTKYNNFGACGFGEEDFFMFFSIVSPWELFVAMETTILIQSAPTSNAVNRPIQ